MIDEEERLARRASCHAFVMRYFNNTSHLEHAARVASYLSIKYPQMLIDHGWPKVLGWMIRTCTTDNTTRAFVSSALNELVKYNRDEMMFLCRQDLALSIEFCFLPHELSNYLLELARDIFPIDSLFTKAHEIQSKLKKVLNENWNKQQNLKEHEQETHSKENDQALAANSSPETTVLPDMDVFAFDMDHYVLPFDRKAIPSLDLSMWFGAEDSNQSAKPSATLKISDLATRVADAAENEWMIPHLVESDALIALRIFYETQRDKLLQKNSNPHNLEKEHARLCSEVARAVANLSQDTNGAQDAVKAGWPPILNEWKQKIRANFGALHAQSLRALVNMYPCEVKYSPELWLLHAQHPLSVPEVDIVLIHGLRGGALLTWRTQLDGEEGDLVLWPRDWLGAEFTNSRILSLSYDTRLSGWTGPNRNLPEQATRALKAFAQAQLGQNNTPILFCTHSYGGLISKQALVLAKSSDNPQWKHILSNVRGLVFFGTPHHGSPLANLVNHAFFQSVLKPSECVVELFPGANQLEELNYEFRRIVERLGIEDHIYCFGEGKSTAIGTWRGRRFSSYLVPPRSADVGFGHFQLISGVNHIQLCKPRNPNDSRFIRICHIVSNITKNDSMKN